MNTAIKNLLKYGLIFIGYILLIPIIYVAYCYLTYIDETITSGSAYGFSIGQKKDEVYKNVQTQFVKGDIFGLDSGMNREKELEQHKEILDYLWIFQVQSWFDRWDTWELWRDKDGNGIRDKESLLLILSFTGDSLSRIEFPVYTNGYINSTIEKQEWNPSSIDNSLKVSIGQTYEEVFANLLAFSKTPNYKDVLISTGWMARRQPIKFSQDEYSLVEPYDRWSLFKEKNKSYFNRLILTFKNNVLHEIHRHQQNFELP